MKKILTGLFCLLCLIAVQAQTADDIITKYEAAVGGREKLLAIRDLQVNSTLKMGMMGQSIELPLTLVRRKDMLFRRQIGGVMGMGDSFTMLTDTSGYVFIPAMRFGRGGGGGGGDFGGGPGGFGGGLSANEPTITRMKPEDVTAQQYELDCAGAFAELVNYAAKGHKAELVGTEKVNKVVCNKVKFTLKSGQVVTYYFDAQTNLVKQLEATGDMALNLTGFGSMMKAFGSNVRKDTKATMMIREYGEFSGIKYPVKYTLNFGPVESEVENNSVKINEGLEDKWFRLK